MKKLIFSAANSGEQAHKRQFRFQRKGLLFFGLLLVAFSVFSFQFLVFLLGPALSR